MSRTSDNRCAELLSTYSEKTVLITGASGFIGTRLRSMLRTLDVQLICISRAVPPETHNGREIWIQGDLSDSSPWENALEHPVDVVFHCAAQTSAYAADSEPVEDLRLNVAPIVHLLELCHKKKFSPFIVLASTITIAGLAQARLIDESTTDAPVTVYDLHKLFAEQYLRCYVARDLARGTSLRLANVYGHGPKSGKEDRGILNKMIRRAMDGEPLCVYQPGTFVRDYLHVQDAGLAFLLAAAHPETTNGQHFVIGTGERNTLLEAANIVASHVGDRIGIKIPVKLIPSPHPLSPIENRQYGVDSRYFREMTGWRPDIMLSKGILNVLEEAE